MKYMVPSIHGQPQAGDIKILFNRNGEPVQARVHDGISGVSSMFRYLPQGTVIDFGSLPHRDEVEPPPLPKGWDPIEELEDRHPFFVWLLYADGSVYKRPARQTERRHDEQSGRGGRVGYALCEAPDVPKGWTAGGR